MKRTDLLNPKKDNRNSAVKELSVNEMLEIRGGISNPTTDPKDLE